MEKEQEVQIRAQSMINSLAAQRLEALDRCVHLAAELDLAKARIAELEAQQKEAKVPDAPAAA